MNVIFSVNEDLKIVGKGHDFISSLENAIENGETPAYGFGALPVSPDQIEFAKKNLVERGWNPEAQKPASEPAPQDKQPQEASDAAAAEGSEAPEPVAEEAAKPAPKKPTRKSRAQKASE